MLDSTPRALLNTIESWLNALDPKKPLIIGYSGGADSKALFHAALSIKQKPPLLLAHYNHGWRKEADEEANLLEEEAKKLSIPFYTKKAEKVPTSSMEDHARAARLEFFLELQKKHGASGVALAHHKEDLAETILKRILEGSSVEKCLAMQKKSHLGELTIYRPLLDMSKKTLKTFLIDKKISYFQDKTNREEKFLRSRFRESIFPFIEKSFGKNVKNNLITFAKECHEIGSYAKKSSFDQKPFIEGPFGSCLEEVKKFSFIERKLFIREEAKRKGSPLSRNEITALLNWIEEEKSGVYLLKKRCTIYLYRKNLFFLPHLNRPCFDFAIDLTQEKGEEKHPIEKPLWKSLFLGKPAFFLPVGEKYRLEKRVSFSKKQFSKKGIPHFLREFSWGFLSSSGKFYSPFALYQGEDPIKNVSLDFREKGFSEEKSPQNIAFLL